jgi:alpha-glucosidase
MKRWISLILTAALCTSMCCIYAEDAVLGTSDEAQSIVLQEDSSQTTEVGSVSVPEDESEQEDLPADSSGQEISPEEPDPSSVFAEEEEQLNQDFVTAEPSLPEEGIQTQEPVFPERTAEELDTDMTSVNPADLTTESPDGSLSVQFELNESGQLFYTVFKAGNLVLEPSQMGITANHADFTSGLAVQSTQLTSCDETYSLPQGKKSQYRNHYNQREIVLEKDGRICKIYFRMYDDGIAFRYELLGEGAVLIQSETSQFNLPDSTGGWAFDWRNDYEGLYTYRSPSEFSSANFAMPVLASIDNNRYWMLLTEGNVYNSNGSYCASHLDGSAGEVMKVAFAPEQTSAVSTIYPVQTPYRVAIITDNLNDLANSVLMTNLNPPTTMSDTSWIKTGKSAWSWWSEERSPQWFERQRDYVDFAAENGWDFVTVDAGWDDSWVEQLCTEAADKNVSVVIWTDVDAIDTQQEVDEKLTRWASWGVAGIKVDFMMNDSQMRMATYQLIAEKAGELHMLVNFHGSTKPSGEIRTWPHVTTSEAVRGSEHYKWGEYSTAYQNSTLPFTRNVIGPMDFTPTVVSNSNLNTTHAHQLALSVIFESGMQHLADSIDSYEAWKGKNFLNKVPASWDELRVLDAFPGDYAVIARRKGNEWYLGAITSAARTITIDCDFLGAGYTAYIYKDSDNPTMMATDVQAVDSSSVLMLDLASTGGCAILFTNENFLQELQDDASYAYYEAESSQNSLTGQASVVQDGNCFGEKKVGNLGGSASSSVTFENVTAASAGSYEVKLYYASGDQRNISLWVNNGEERVLELPATGSYHTLRCQRFYVELDAGVNQLRFGGTSYAPDVDRIAVRAAEPQYYTKMEAEDGIITSPAYAQNSSGFSGEKKVSYVGYAGEVTLNNVHVEQSGTYLLRVYYATGDNRTLMISANGGAPVRAICFDSGSFNSVEYKEVLISLNAGENSLRFFNSDGYAPDLDYFEIAASPIA